MPARRAASSTSCSTCDSRAIEDEDQPRSAKACKSRRTATVFRNSSSSLPSSSPAALTASRIDSALACRSIWRTCSSLEGGRGRRGARRASRDDLARGTSESVGRATTCGTEGQHQNEGVRERAVNARLTPSVATRRFLRGRIANSSVNSSVLPCSNDGNRSLTSIFLAGGGASFSTSIG